MSKICKKCGKDKSNDPDYLKHSSLCAECDRIRRINGYNENKDIRLKSSKIYYEENREKILASKKVYGENNKDSILTKKKKRYDENTEEMRDRQNKWRRDNKNRDLWHGAKRRAKECGLEFDIKPEDIIIPEVCPALGIRIDGNNSSAKDNSPSLDRIDNSKGYVKGNVCVISYRANSIKRDGNIEELKKIIEYIERMSKSKP